MENFASQSQNHSRSYLAVERNFDSLPELVIPGADQYHNQLQKAANQDATESISSPQLLPPMTDDHVIMDDGTRVNSTARRSSSSSGIIQSKLSRSKSSLVQDLFLVLDTDRDGKLSVEEIYDLLRKFGLASSSSTHDIHGDSRVLGSLRSLIRGFSSSQYTDHQAGLQSESSQHEYDGLDLSGFRALYRYVMEGGHHNDPIQPAIRESGNSDQAADAGERTYLNRGAKSIADDDDHDDCDEKMRNDYIDSIEDADVEAAFRVYDRNRDGFISASELAMVLHQLGLPEGDDVVACQACIDRHDSDGNGLIDLSEFKSMMLPFLLAPISCH